MDSRRRFALVSSLFVMTIQAINCFWKVGASLLKKSFAFLFRASASENSGGTSMLIAGRGSFPQWPNLLAASILARPNSVMRPSMMTFSARFLLTLDQRLLFFLGVNLRQYL